MRDLAILLEGRNIWRLLEGLGVTLKISLVAVLLSLALGVLLGMFMTLRNPVTRVISRLYLEFVRIMPQLVLLFLAYFGLTRAFGWNLSGEAAAILVFTVWGTAEMGDLVRGAVMSIPRHQYDSAHALGLTKPQTYAYVVLPQTFKRLVPPAINLTTRMIKTTSLVVLIGVVEVLKIGQQIIEANRYTAPGAALWIYIIIFFLYFIVCFPISRLGRLLENKWRD
ncbi:amino acid ABC transporter permease [Clostridia bacterium]|nr:amino acid ABC transporter permease [Clostridia bacterium]